MLSNVMANLPMTRLSIGRESPSTNCGIPEQQTHETILSLNLDTVTSDHFSKERSHGLIDDCQQGSRIHGSSKSLKRKRAAHMSDQGDEETEASIVLELGQTDSSRGAQEEFPLMSFRLISGNLDSIYNDKSFNYGTAAGERSQTVGMAPGGLAVEPGELLQLGSLGKSHAAAGSGGGLAWQARGRHGDSRIEKDAGTHLGLGPPRNGYRHLMESLTGREYENGAGMLLGLRPSDMSADNRGDYEGVAGDVPVVDEGSTSARLRSGGYMPSLLMGACIIPSMPYDTSHIEVTSGKQHTEEDVGEQDFSVSLQASTGGGPTCTSAAFGHSDRAPKVCKFRGCGKGPRGASGLCIAHGGGRRCQKHGCNKGAEGRTVYCKAHGGGRRCQNLGCTKSAEGKTDFCIGHGGGRRCSNEGCDKAARGRSGLCIRHGGGKRCQIEGCTRSAEGYSGLCISHGGGRRCQFTGCSKGAQGSTMFCKAHGGGKRCIIAGCNKGAEGSTPLCKGHGGGKRCLFDGGGICTKSVHGGTLYCVAHGGGKRCAVEGCAKSARGRTEFCVRHGGGKRCKVEGCGKSAQGSTDFCKAHGGGKRCQWKGLSLGDSFRGEIGGRDIGTHCDKFARGKTGLCAAHSALVQDRRVHGAGALGPPVTSGLAPGLFRGLVSGLGQGPPSANTPTCLGGAASSSRPAGSGPDRQTQNCLTKGANFSGPRDKSWGRNRSAPEVTLLHATHSPIELWPRVGSSISESAMSSQAMGSMGYNAMDIESQCLTGRSTSLLSPAGFSPFQQPLIPPKVLVPLSMQERGKYYMLGVPANKPRYGRPPRPPTSTSDEGVFDMASLTLPEGRVHGGSLMAQLTNRALSPGGDMSLVGSSIIRSHRIDPTGLEMTGSRGVDGGQFLATGVDLNRRSH